MDYRLEDAYPTFRRLVPMLDCVATGFTFTEGPVWRGDDLLFSDIPNNRTIRYRPLPEGPEITTFRTPSGNANGLTLDRQGRLLACEHSGRRVSRVDESGRAETVVDSYKGKRLNSPNDVVVRSDGSIFFTDPPYGLRNGTEGKELDVNGVYRIDPGGELHLLVDDFDRPNGLAFTPDERRLLIDDTVRGHIRVFDVAGDGSLSNGRVFAELKGAPGERGAPDGMKVDSEGNVYCTGPAGVWVFDPNGRFLGRIVTPEVPANLAWGDPDWRTLYITARTSLYRIRLAVPGIPVGLAAARAAG
ncbi:MAG TPA: SMP-30/gluconolactonase/LRE family protein [Chloroflexota bacterium]|nr:SMP-30/gluconolactonase/LRE family protein [Chloroflexota bacterium]